VHLNEDTEAGRRRAREVGARHGDAVLLRIDTRRVDSAFYRSESGIWLIEAVPPEAIGLDD
jgi:RNA:NAD 2'-phosphotransferase (TPT1/KptA family)